jgi:hypothetical protein
MIQSKRYSRLAVTLAGIQLLFGMSSNAQNEYSYVNNRNATIQTGHPTDKNVQNEKQTLFAVLKDLNRIKGTFFLFSSEGMGNKIVNPIKDEHSSVEKILTEVLKNTGLKYKKNIR